MSTFSLPNPLAIKNIAVVALVVFALLTGAVVAPAQAAPGGLKPPGTYTSWYWPDYPATTHTTMDGFLRILSDPTLAQPRIGYFWANQFFLPGGGGYMGIQTNGQAGSYRGKVAIFSMWNTTQGVSGANCTIIASGFDGDPASGSTCRIPLAWQAGDMYRLRLRVLATGSTTRNWQASVLNQRTGVEKVIGVITTTISYGLLQGALTNWTEFYSPGRAECDAPYSDVMFGTPTLDGSAAPNSHKSNVSAQNGCTNSAVVDSPIGVRQQQSIPLSSPPAPLPAGGTYLSDLSWTSATTGAGTIAKDRAITGQPIILAGKTYAKGIGTHATSDIRYPLNAAYSRFVAYVNLDDASTGQVGYEVWADGVKLFDSGRMDAWSLTKQINVDVSGRRELRLVVNDGGNGIPADWANWADARLIRPS